MAPLSMGFIHANLSLPNSLASLVASSPYLAAKDAGTIYVILAKLSKPGHQLKQVGHYSSSCLMLSQISVHINHKNDVKIPIPLVLLSLSGEYGYRDNSVFGARGTFLLDNFDHGIFFVCPD